MRSLLHAAGVGYSSWSVKSLCSDVLSDVSVRSAVLGLKLAPSPAAGCRGSAHIRVQTRYRPRPQAPGMWQAVTALPLSGAVGSGATDPTSSLRDCVLGPE